MASGINDETKRIHSKLCIEFDQNLPVESSEYDDFVTAMSAAITPRDKKECKKPSDFIAKLQQNGKCAPGNYIRLREMLSAFTKNQDLFAIIDTAEAAIRDARGLDMDMK